MGNLRMQKSEAEFENEVKRAMTLWGYTYSEACCRINERLELDRILTETHDLLESDNADSTANR
jgi:hypothetical protein